MATYSGSLRCAGASIGAHRHICAFFNGLDEEYRVLGSFYKDGFDRGEKATHIVEAENRGEHLKRLGEAGVDVQGLMQTGQLEVLPWTDMYVRDQRFDQDAILASVEKIIRSAGVARHGRTKMVAPH